MALWKLQSFWKKVVFEIHRVFIEYPKIVQARKKLTLGGGFGTKLLDFKMLFQIFFETVRTRRPRAQHQFRKPSETALNPSHNIWIKYKILKILKIWFIERLHFQVRTSIVYRYYEQDLKHVYTKNQCFDHKLHAKEYWNRFWTLHFCTRVENPSEKLSNDDDRPNSLVRKRWDKSLF